MNKYKTFKMYKSSENKTDLPSSEPLDQKVYRVKFSPAEASGLSSCMQEYGLRTYRYLKNYLEKNDRKCFRSWVDKSMTNDCLPAIALDCLNPILDERVETAESILKRIDRISGISQIANFGLR